MALTWPHGTPTLPRLTPVDGRSAADSRDTAPSTPAASVGAGIVAALTSPLTALAAMLVGLVLLFVLPLAGLPFVALVVLPLVVFHLRAEGRSRRRPARR